MNLGVLDQKPQKWKLQQYVPNLTSEHYHEKLLGMGNNVIKREAYPSEAGSSYTFCSTCLQQDQRVHLVLASSKTKGFIWHCQW